MSYSIQEAKQEFEHDVNQALQNGDIDALHRYINQMDEDDAAPLIATIKRWKQEDDDDWAYDRAVDNGLI